MPIVGPGCRNASARVRLVGERRVTIASLLARIDKARNGASHQRWVSAFGAKADVRWSPLNFAF
jgi:hypothetical protein